MASWWDGERRRNACDRGNLGVTMTMPPDYSEEDRLRQESESLRRRSDGVLPSDREDAPEHEIEEHRRAEWEVDHLDPEANEARAPGQVCARCGAVITAGQDVRQMADGRWMHEVCPVDPGRPAAEVPRSPGH
jgi:hypothetical protein